MICDECETVAHCSKHGCIPKQPDYEGAIEVSVIFHEGQRMFAVPKQVAQQEPVAYIRVSKTGHVMVCAKTGDFYKLPDKTLLYTSPPAQRTWVGLTDEEIARVVSLAGFAPDWAEAHIATQIVRVLETKLKEKNNG